MSPLDSLTNLLDTSAVASLAVNDQGYPFVSPIPYALLRDPLRFYILISDLAAHTAPLRQDPRCGLTIHAIPQPEDPKSNHALTRVMIKGDVEFLSREQATARGAEAQYRQKYAIADMILGLMDFHFCQITPTDGLFVQGFGQIYQLSGSNLKQMEPFSRK